jgi:hypothetical protein
MSKLLSPLLVFFTNKTCLHFKVVGVPFIKGVVVFLTLYVPLYLQVKNTCKGQRKKRELFADLSDANGIVGNSTSDFYFVAYKLGYFLRIADCIDFVIYYKALCLERSSLAPQWASLIYPVQVPLSAA